MKETYWNYRLVEKEERMPNGDVEKYINVHSVHYSANGKIELYSAEPIDPQGESLSAILKDLAFMQHAASLPILKWSDLEDPKIRKTLK